MKQHVLLVGVLLLSAVLSFAQSHLYNVVFDITSKDTADQKTVIRLVKEISSTDPNAHLEVVLYGQSLDMVVKDRSMVAQSVQELTANKNVAFKVCAIAMKHHNIDKSQLLTNVDTVPDGIYEIVSKQGDGWGYIKVAH